MTTPGVYVLGSLLGRSASLFGLKVKFCMRTVIVKNSWLIAVTSPGQPILPAPKMSNLPGIFAFAQKKCWGRSKGNSKRSFHKMSSHTPFPVDVLIGDSFSIFVQEPPGPEFPRFIPISWVMVESKIVDPYLEETNSKYCTRLKQTNSFRSLKGENLFVSWRAGKPLDKQFISAAPDKHFYQLCSNSQ